MKENVFGEERVMSLREYNLTIGALLLYGFLINIFICRFFVSMYAGVNEVLLTFLSFGFAIIGEILALSNNSKLSFFGYTVVSISIGVILSLCVKDTAKVDIMNAVIVTAIVTFTMILLSCIKPELFLSLGKILFFCLFFAIIIEVILIIIRFAYFRIWDIMIAVLFSLFIGYDWAEAQKRPKCFGNALVSVVGLYLDIINLFLRSSRISSSKK